jgi:hypothetical protein
MGKRELGLILAFAVVGILVWQVTAPRAEGPGFSVSNWLSEVRREIHGRRASAEVISTPAIPMDDSINELRLTLSGEITVTGEDRQDVAAELRVVSNGFDEAEAKKLAGETALKVSKFADSVVLAWQFPDPGSQQPRLTLKVPRRLRVQLEGRGSVEVSGVSSIMLARPAGTLKLTNVTGLIKGEYRGGDLTIDGAQALDLSTVGGESLIKGIKEDIRISARGGEVRLDKTTGRVTITGTDTRIRVDGTAGDLRAETVEGELELHDVGGSIDIDARATPVQVGWSRAAAAKIQVRNGDLEIDLPKDAETYSLDARAAGGELRVPDSLQKKTEGEESAVTKTAGANAPSIFVRGVGASITIR